MAIVERRPQEALSLAPLGWGLLGRVDNPPFLVALLHNNIATAWDALGETRRAIVEYEESLALLTRHAPEDPLRWAVLNNVAKCLNHVGEYARTRAMAGDALLLLEKRYDPCYPAAAALRDALANADAANGQTERALAGYTVALDCFAGYTAYILQSLDDLGYVHLQRGDEVQAQAQIDRADALLRAEPDTHIHGWGIEMLRIDVALRRGRLDEAQRLLDALAADTELLRGIDSIGLAAIELRRGIIAHREHDDERALEHLQRAEKVMEPGRPVVERGLYAFTLARVLRGLGRELERAGALADAAATAYTTAGALYAGEVAAIRAWQAGP